jgi:hypothetical protein
MGRESCDTNKQHVDATYAFFMGYNDSKEGKAIKADLFDKYMSDTHSNEIVWSEACKHFRKFFHEDSTHPVKKLLPKAIPSGVSKVKEQMMRAVNQEDQ